MKNLLIYTLAAVLWTAGRRQGRDEGRTAGFREAAGIFAAGAAAGARGSEAGQ